MNVSIATRGKLKKTPRGTCTKTLTGKFHAANVPTGPVSPLHDTYFHGCSPGFPSSEKVSAQEGKRRGASGTEREELHGSTHGKPEQRERCPRPSSSWGKSFLPFPPHQCAKGHLSIGFGPELVTFPDRFAKLI